MDKKAITSIIATTLLVLVSVVALVGFQTWYNSFQSDLLAKTEQRANLDSVFIGIEAINDNNLIFRAGTSSFIKSIKLDQVNCNFEEKSYSGLVSIDVTQCLIDLNKSRTEVVVITNKGVYSKNLFIS